MNVSCMTHPFSSCYQYFLIPTHIYKDTYRTYIYRCWEMCLYCVTIEKYLLCFLLCDLVNANVEEYTVVNVKY